jgi:hypothetical protein
VMRARDVMCYLELRQPLLELLSAWMGGVSSVTPPRRIPSVQLCVPNVSCGFSVLSMAPRELTHELREPHLPYVGYPSVTRRPPPTSA